MDLANPVIRPMQWANENEEYGNGNVNVNVKENKVRRNKGRSWLNI